MITDVNFYRERASEAARQAEALAAGHARDRCQRFAAWWSAIGDAVEADDIAGASALTENVIVLNPQHP